MKIDGDDLLARYRGEVAALTHRALVAESRVDALLKHIEDAKAEAVNLGPES